MKKISLILAVVMAAILTSCNQSAPNASLKTDIDTLSYAIGMSQTQGLKEYLNARMGIDTTLVDDFIQHPEKMKAAGEAASQYIYGNAGAVDKCYEAIFGS